MRKQMMIATAGLAIGSFGFLPVQTANAQTRDPARQPDSTRHNDKNQHNDSAHRQANGDYQPNFVSGDKLRGKNVHNLAGDTLGEIDELIIDRGSGQIAYIVLKSGSFLGIGGKNVVVPYSAFGWNAADKRVTLETTPDVIKAWPEFNSEKWAASSRSENVLANSLADQYYAKATKPRAYPADKAAENTRIKGKIKEITRQSADGDSEMLVVTVVGDDNNPERVIVGPSWYLAGNSITLFRDAPVDIQVIRVDDAGSPAVLARNMKLDSRDVEFYDDKGTPLWTRDKAAGRVSSAYTPFILSKEIDGKHVDSRGERFGKIDDLVIECHSGRVAFLSIDPDQNVLGLGDTKRLVPWTIAMSIGEDAVALDANKQMLAGSQATPSDLESLGNGDSYRGFYTPFEVNPPQFDRPRR